MIELEGDPKGKGRPRFRIIRTKAGATFGSAYTPAATRSYEARLTGAAVKAMGQRPPLAGPLAVLVIATMPIPKSWPAKKRDAALAGTVRHTTKPDWENIAKCLDAFNEVVWGDDSQVVDGRVVKVYGERPMLRVEVREADLSPLFR